MFYDKTQISKTIFFFSDLKWILYGNKAKLTEWARIETFNYWRHFYFLLSFHVAQIQWILLKLYPCYVLKIMSQKCSSVRLSPGEIISMWMCSVIEQMYWRELGY